MLQTNAVALGMRPVYCIAVPNVGVSVYTFPYNIHTYHIRLSDSDDFTQKFQKNLQQYVKMSSSYSMNKTNSIMLLWMLVLNNVARLL